MPRRHEERDVAQPVLVEPPDEREEHLARGGEGEAREERGALTRRRARPQRDEHRPRDGGRGVLARARPELVEREAEGDRRHDERFHGSILA